MEKHHDENNSQQFLAPGAGASTTAPGRAQSLRRALERPRRAQTRAGVTKHGGDPSPLGGCDDAAVCVGPFSYSVTRSPITLPVHRDATLRIKSSQHYAILHHSSTPVSPASLSSLATSNLQIDHKAEQKGGRKNEYFSAQDTLYLMPLKLTGVRPGINLTRSARR